jgi:hypothetical protein
MQNEQQQLQVEFKNAPVDVFQVHCSVNEVLNKEETLSVSRKVLTCNNLDGNLHRQTGELKAKVFVLSIKGKPLMPCKPAKARHLLKDNKAEVMSVKPFTIKLKFECENKTQLITLGIDSGYKYVGFSAVTDKTELIAGELKLRTDVSKKIKDRAMYRRLKRNKLWYRQPRFLNRTKSKKKGWLAPSIRHKVDTHIRLIDKLKTILPITKVIVEVAKFDTQKLQNADIKGKEYQQGQMQGYDNLRAFILHRDNYTCQICKKKNGIMNIHHIIHKSKGGSNRPANLVTVHKLCHDKFHKGKIKHKFKKPKSFKQTVIMNNIRKYIVNKLNCDYTYGYITKRNRIKMQLNKSHINDAFIISKGKNQNRCKLFTVKQVRRHNRCLQKNRKGFKLAIRKQRYKFQPNDSVMVDNKKYIVKGTHCKGLYVVVSDNINKPKSISVNKLYSQIYGQGLSFENYTSTTPLFEKMSIFEIVSD